MLIIHIILGFVVMLAMAITMTARNRQLVLPVRVGAILQLFSGVALFFVADATRVCVSALAFGVFYALFELQVRKHLVSSAQSSN